MHKLTENGYIIAVSATAAYGTEITEQEYNNILSTIQNKPQQKNGFALMLKNETLEWEYVPLPEPVDENAEVSDYENALSDLGVKFSD